MLDVHPAHHAAGTWRDFFIHIATICVGLLIAISLEQTVERIHQHYELRETREALEREQNPQGMAAARKLTSDRMKAANTGDPRREPLRPAAATPAIQHRSAFLPRKTSQLVATQSPFATMIRNN
jgi:hypothetical protein